MASVPNCPARIMGIDPGLNATGYGVVECCAEKVKLLEAGIIRSPKRRTNDMPSRLQSIFEEVQGVIAEFCPQTVCLEEVYSHPAYPQTSILMGHARGVICLAARLARIPVVNFSAKRIKQSVTGNGNASKTQVQRAIQEYFSLRRQPDPSDVADALAAALCYVNSLAASRIAGASRGRRNHSKQPSETLTLKHGG